MLISGGVLVENRRPDHSDERRDLFTLFNGNFVAEQVKYVVVHQNAVLGNHYHDYDELFFLLKGKAVFYVQEPHGLSSKQRIEMSEGMTIVVLAGFAHVISIEEGSILFGCTEKPYISSQDNDKPFPMNIEELEKEFSYTLDKGV